MSIDDAEFDAWFAARRAVLEYRANYSTIGGNRKDGKTGRTHGATSTYASGCRCDECRAAKAAATRRWRESKRKAP